MGFFCEIKIRQDGKERYVDASKFFKYMLKEHLHEETSKGGVIPYPDEENKQEVFDLWWNLYDKKRSKKKTFKYWDNNIKSEVVSDIMKHTKDYILSNEKQFRKDPHSYLLNESWKDEIILDPEAIAKQKAEYFEKKREADYKIQKEKQRSLEKDSADDDWLKTYLSGISKNLKNKGAK